MCRAALVAVLIVGGQGDCLVDGAKTASFSGNAICNVTTLDMLDAFCDTSTVVTVQPQLA